MVLNRHPNQSNTDINNCLSPTSKPPATYFKFIFCHLLPNNRLSQTSKPVFYADFHTSVLPRIPNQSLTSTFELIAYRDFQTIVLLRLPNNCALHRLPISDFQTSVCLTMSFKPVSYNEFQTCVLRLLPNQCLKPTSDPLSLTYSKPSV